MTWGLPQISLLMWAIMLWFNTFNMCPTGSKHERGILAWNKAHEDDSSNTLESGEVYNLPFSTSASCSSSPWLRYIPFCPPGLPSADTAALDNKRPLGRPEPSQIIIGAPLWVAHSHLYFLLKDFYLFFLAQAARFEPLVKLYCNHMVQEISHQPLEWNLQMTSYTGFNHRLPLGKWKLTNSEQSVLLDIIIRYFLKLWFFF